ncbi:methylenetetrahydrofolate reductase [Chloroflexota bacterium]
MNTDGQSRLQQVLTSGGFVVTAECGPPRGANAEVIVRKGKLLKGYVDAVNVTDNQTAIVRMSSIAACVQLKQMGLEAIMQTVTRDRNRIALQSDIMGAYALGIRNILCLSGDHQTFGNQPDALNVFDIDSIHMLRMLKIMRDEGRDMSGFELDTPPQMFIGAAANPFADPFEYRVIRLAKKIEAGAQFVQTQCIYNMSRFKEWLRLAREEGLTSKAYILGGITPLKSARMAKYMAANVAGMDIPHEVIKRLEGVPREKTAAEGIKICLETIAELRREEGVSGVHIMAIEDEAKVSQIVEAAGLMPRPEAA